MLGRFRISSMRIRVVHEQLLLVVAAAVNAALRVAVVHRSGLVVDNAVGATIAAAVVTVISSHCQSGGIIRVGCFVENAA